MGFLIEKCDWWTDAFFVSLQVLVGASRFLRLLESIPKAGNLAMKLLLNTVNDLGINQRILDMWPS